MHKLVFGNLCQQCNEKNATVTIDEFDGSTFRICEPCHELNIYRKEELADV